VKLKFIDSDEVDSPELADFLLEHFTAATEAASRSRQKSLLS